MSVTAGRRDGRFGPVTATRSQNCPLRAATHNDKDVIDMALTASELALHTPELLPSREVMSTAGGHFNNHASQTWGPACNEYYGGILNGANLQDIASDINIDEVQVGLVNVIVEDLHDVADVGSANTEL